MALLKRKVTLKANSNGNIKSNLNFHDFFKSVNNLPKNFINRDLIVITAESLERTFYKNKNSQKNI